MSRFPGMEPYRAELDHSPRANSTDAENSSVAVVEKTGKSAELLPLAASSYSDTTFRCPGESHPVSLSVHLARLASGYSACGKCSQNVMSGHAMPARKVTVRDRNIGRSLVTVDGIRGIYLNELDRTRAADWSAAFASLLWEQQPRIGRSSASAASSNADPDANSPGSDPAADSSAGNSANLPEVGYSVTALTQNRPRRGPVVAMGFDERPASPDIVMGVALGLRRMGCQVIDLGGTTRPCFHFGVHHLEAAGGVFVTGSGCDPSATGFHFAGRDSVPWTSPEILGQLESRAMAKVARPTRTAGAQRPFHADIPYQASLWKLFHALRPLRIVCGAATRRLPRVLDSLFARLPCHLTHETLPTRRRDLSSPHDVDVRRVAAAVVAGQHHLGLIVDDDDERCAFVTERGQLVSTAELARLLIRFELHEHRTAKFVLDQSLMPNVADWLNSLGADCRAESATAHQLPAILRQHESSLGFTSDHRVWFGGDYPACNSIRTLARVLQALSLSDTPMSEVLR